MGMLCKTTLPDLMRAELINLLRDTENALRDAADPTAPTPPEELLELLADRLDFAATTLEANLPDIPGWSPFFVIT